MGEIRLRKEDGNAPFIHRLNTPAGAPLESITTNSREQLMGSDPASFAWEVEDASGKKVSGRVDAVTKGIQKTIWNGFNTTNGNVTNHKNAMDAAFDLGLNMQGCVFGMANAWTSDAEFDSIIWQQQFNHINGAIETPTDETVKHAELKGIPITIMFDPQVNRHNLNNGSTRTKFYADADLMKRADGSNVTQSVAPTDPNEADFGVPMVGSIMAPAYRTYYKVGFAKVFTRYRDAFNDGTILWAYPKQAQTAESHYEMRYRYNQTETGDADGDYHYLMIEALKTDLQSQYTISQFNAAFGTSIASWNDINAGYLSGNSFSTPLRKYWYWFRNEQLAIFYDEMWAYIQANVPGLTRTAAGGYDMGSLTDTQGLWRGCYGIGRFLENSFVMAIKSNDGTSFPKKWCTTLLASLAESYNCVARIEPTGPGDSMANDQEGFNEFIDHAKDRNVGVSYIDQPNVNYALVQNNIILKGIATYRTKTARNVINGNGTLNTYNYTLTRMLNEGGAFGSIAGEMQALAGQVLVTITDDIRPNPLI